jgi:hypothetical protein
MYSRGHAARAVDGSCNDCMVMVVVVNDSLMASLEGKGLLLLLPCDVCNVQWPLMYCAGSSAQCRLRLCTLCSLLKSLLSGRNHPEC